MSTGFWRSRVSVVAIMLACGGWLGLPWAGQAAAQTPAQTPGPSQVESDPIRCWWRTDRSAVHVGEQFTLLLTCGVIDTARIKVEADPSKLDAAAIALVPFEVLSGTRFKDIQAPPWRYFQYAYTVRLIGDEFFGRDVDIPSTQITYRVTTNDGSSANADEPNDNQTEGVEQLYVLPSLPVRILSLVPASAADIRDPASGTFADIERLLFRATGALVASGIFFGFAAVLAVLAAARIVGRYRSRLPAAARLVPSRGVLRGCLRAVDGLRSDVAREGWTPEFAQRALVLLRLGGAVALERPVAQTVVGDDVQEREGQLILQEGRLRPKRTLLSAPTTAAAIAAVLSNGGGQRRGPGTDAVLEEIRDSLRVFSATRYRRNGQLERSELDTALDQGANAIRRLYTMKRWPMRGAGMFKRGGIGATG